MKLISRIFVLGLLSSLITSGCSRGVNGEYILGEPGSAGWYADASQATIKKYEQKRANKYSAISSNPTVPSNLAYKICRSKANLAKTQAKSNYTPSNENNSSSFDTTCNHNGYKTTCNTTQTTSSSGSVLSGMQSQRAKNNAGKAAYSATLTVCMAKLGWIEN
jgi:hypothetical protein